MYGTLYICGTPIGNLNDITLRALEVLKTCDLIAAEDTRNTLKLLNHFGIQKPITSYHEHNKFVKGKEIIEKLKSGINIALVTDAGMPGISDPGADIVRLCQYENIPFTSAPGPTAFSTAVVLSGIDTRRFIFEGFMSLDKKEREITLKLIEKETRTVIFYEAPHRLKNTLKDILNHAGNRQAACVREITKKFEEVKKGTLEELFEYYSNNEPKGEFVIVLAGADINEIKKEEISAWEKISVEEHIKKYTLSGMSEKDAIKQVAKDRGVSKRDIYNNFKIH